MNDSSADEGPTSLGEDQSMVSRATYLSQEHYFIMKGPRRLISYWSCISRYGPTMAITGLVLDTRSGPLQSAVANIPACSSLYSCRQNRVPHLQGQDGRGLIVLPNIAYY